MCGRGGWRWIRDVWSKERSERELEEYRYIYIDRCVQSVDRKVL